MKRRKHRRDMVEIVTRKYTPKGKDKLFSPRCQADKMPRFNKFERWLESQVGRPWSDVYSYVCRNFTYLEKDFLKYLVNRDVYSLPRFYVANGILRRT